MSVNTLNVSASMAALLLLCLCVALLWMSQRHRWFGIHLRSLLLAFGAIPSSVGVTWGLWLYLSSHEVQLVTPPPYLASHQVITSVFLLLGMGAMLLLRVGKQT
jgi:hypothetical protein